MISTTDYLNQLSSDRLNLVSNLETQGINDLTGNETFTELVPRVLDIQAGGAYTGQLPNNSVITKIVNEGAELHVYLSVDNIASGTRIYYKKDAIPDLNGSYIDVLKNESYGTIPNVDDDSMYGLRVASYVIYDTDKKAFNNSMSIGCYSSKLTKRINSAGAVYMDIPVELQGSSPSSSCYSEYTNMFYYSYGSKIYQVDLNEPNIKFVRIGEWLSFYSNPSLTPTKYGIFIKGEKDWYLYNEKTGSFKKLSMGAVSASQKQALYQLPNGDILATNDYSSDPRSFPIKIFNPNTKDFDTDFLNGAVKWVCGAGGIINSDIGLYLLLGLSGEASDNPGYGIRKALYKYNESTNTYDLVGKFPTNVDQYYETTIYFIKPLLDTMVIAISGGASTYPIFYLKDGEFIKIKNVEYNQVAYPSLQRKINKMIVQSPVDPSILIIAMCYQYGEKVYKINMSTGVEDELYSDSGYNSASYNKDLILYHNKIITARGIYDCETDTWTAHSNNLSEYDSLIIRNDKLYRIGASYLYKYNEDTNTYTSMIQMSTSTEYPKFIDKDEYVYIFGMNKGLIRLNSLTDEVSIINSNKYINGLKLNNKIYFTSSSAYELIVNEDNSYYVSDKVYFYNKLHSYENGTRAGIYNAYIDPLFAPSNLSYGGVHPLGYTSKIWYDETNKKVTGLEDTLIDLSSSTKDYELNFGYDWACNLKTQFFISKDYTEIVVPFNEQPASAMYTLTQPDITNVENMLGESLSGVDYTISERRINNKLNKLIGGIE